MASASPQVYIVCRWMRICSSRETSVMLCFLAVGKSRLPSYARTLLNFAERNVQSSLADLRTTTQFTHQHLRASDAKQRPRRMGWVGKTGRSKKNKDAQGWLSSIDLTDCFDRRVVHQYCLRSPFRAGWMKERERERRCVCVCVCVCGILL